MIFTETKLKDAFILVIEKKEDERGFFARTFCEREFEAKGIQFAIRQSNISFNKKRGTLRGMHMQKSPHKEAKLVQCVSGGIYDVIVDMRQDSITKYEWIGTELSSKNDLILYIPEGFAHGFITLENDTKVLYQMSEFYKPGAEQPLLWNDPFFNINWPMQPEVMSEKDKMNPLFNPALV